MIYRITNYIYLISLLFASICGIYRYKILDTASKVLSILICCAFLNECAAFYLARKFHDNLPLYAIYCFLEFGLICIYFNYIIDIFIQRNLGIYIAITGIILGILNLIFIQNLNSLDSYFLFLEGLSIIGMSLFAFFRLLLRQDTLHLFKYQHFWFISILVFFWSITFLNWGLYDYINMRVGHEAWKINAGLLVISSFTYTCFGVVFLLYPKMQKPNE